MTSRLHNGWLSLVLISLAVSGSAQTPKPTFETASVKKQLAFIPPSRTPLQSSAWFHRLNATVASLIQFAYNINTFQLIGEPEWTRKDLFEINARAASEVPTEQIRLMVQSLLEDRFRLSVHKEQREMRGSALVTARADGRLGPKLEKCDDPGNPTPWKPIRVPPGGDVRFEKCVAISNVADLATRISGSPVIERTGLMGMWNYELAFARSQPLPPGRERDLADQENVPTFTTALEEQLGLKLQSTRGPVDVIVIDSVQQPTEN